MLFHFEYIVSGNLTPVLETKTQYLVNLLNLNPYFIKIERYWDEEINNEKMRNFVLSSQYNTWGFINDFFFKDEKLVDSKLTCIGYRKERII
jgi:hypothetical protein